MSAMFIDLLTNQIFDYLDLKTRFNHISFPSDPFNPAIDPFIEENDIARFYEIPAPSVEAWEIAEVGTPGYEFEGGQWQTKWVVRDLTQPELDAKNEAARAVVQSIRRGRYENEGDPLFFQAMREETTHDAWKDKIAQIRDEHPYPALITLPE